MLRHPFFMGAFRLQKDLRQQNNQTIRAQLRSSAGRPRAKGSEYGEFAIRFMQIEECFTATQRRPNRRSLIHGKQKGGSIKVAVTARDATPYPALRGVEARRKLHVSQTAELLNCGGWPARWRLEAAVQITFGSISSATPKRSRTSAWIRRASCSSCSPVP